MSNSKIAGLSQAQIEALAAQQIERNPLAKISLWPNAKRRDGKNDAHFTGQLQLNTVQLASALAKALAEEKTEVSLWIDVWQNDPAVGKTGGDRPILSGRARNFVESRAAQGDAQSESIVAKLTAATKSAA